MAKNTASNKEKYSQFYTVGNPFVYQPFKDWLAQVPASVRKVALEPFAGSGHIPEHLKQELKQWAMYDIDPKSPTITAQDTLANFPKGFALCITNPPYIAKNAAKRLGIPYPQTKHDDLYKVALEVMLANCQYVAAIIPESFITAGLFQDRLAKVISIPEKLFTDTDHPVCLALFDPTSTPDFAVYRGNKLLGLFTELKAHQPVKSIGVHNISFNMPDGNLGLVAIDNTRGASIHFTAVEQVPREEIKHSSRSKTRILWSPPVQPTPARLKAIIQRGNTLLDDLRTATGDIFLTSFKGIRKDGAYRRRLDWDTARRILERAIAETEPKPKTKKRKRKNATPT